MGNNFCAQSPAAFDLVLSGKVEGFELWPPAGELDLTASPSASEDSKYTIHWFHLVGLWQSTPWFVST